LPMLLKRAPMLKTNCHQNPSKELCAEKDYILPNEAKMPHSMHLCPLSRQARAWSGKITSH
jgi:hypothetical protein